MRESEDVCEELEQSWQQFMHYYQNELRYGEITLQIKDGLPVVATYVKKKIKFT